MKGLPAPPLSNHRSFDCRSSHDAQQETIDMAPFESQPRHQAWSNKGNTATITGRGGAMAGELSGPIAITVAMASTRGQQ